MCISLSFFGQYGFHSYIRCCGYESIKKNDTLKVVTQFKHTWAGPLSAFVFQKERASWKTFTMSFVYLPLLSFVIFACFSPIRALLNGELAASRRRSIWNISNEQTTQCYLASKFCNLCERDCKTSEAHAYFTKGHPALPHIGYSQVAEELNRCKVFRQRLRRRLPDWCESDEKHYFATEEFSPSSITCSREPQACARWIGGEADNNLKKRVWDAQDPRYLLSKKIQNLGIAKENLTIEIRRTNRSEEEADEIMTAWKERWLDAAVFHLEHPEETETKFADPVFSNYSFFVNENPKMESEIRRNNLLHAKNENEHTRSEALTRIPLYLSSISRLKNHVVSNEKETEGYLREIKAIASRTAQLQLEATNIIYETTHSTNLDEEIILLDEELLDLYIRLKGERSTLQGAKERSTFSKLQLVGMMRRLVKEISIRQAECPSSELFAIPEV